jgi:hemoglobin
MGAGMAQTPYEILGDDGIRALADAFYEAMDSLPQAAEIRAMHAANLDDIKRKLAAYLTGWMGGPPVYLALKGTVCLTDPHAPYHIGPEERDQWLLCMDEALERIGASDELKAMLKEPMYRIADTVRNQESSERKPRDPNIIAVGR